MRVSVSNIAWDASEDETIAKLLQRFDVDAIDIAPGKYFPHPLSTAYEEIAVVKRWWLDRGIEVTGLQGLLFGTTGLNVFGSIESQDAMLLHLNAVCRIAAHLGARRVVFGSPKNRDRTGLSDQQALDVAIHFFRRLGDLARAHDVFICLEPNPSCYGANFMTSSGETADVVQRIAHPAILMQLDTGALTINREDPFDVLRNCAPLIGHIHASEPGLLPLGDGGTDHARMSTALGQYLPDHVVSLEMLATNAESHESSIERALSIAIQYYGDEKMRPAK